MLAGLTLRVTTPAAIITGITTTFYFINKVVLNKGQLGS
jgi:hypothetical protein